MLTAKSKNFVRAGQFLGKTGPQNTAISAGFPDTRCCFPTRGQTLRGRHFPSLRPDRCSQPAGEVIPAMSPFALDPLLFRGGFDSTCPVAPALV